MNITCDRCGLPVNVNQPHTKSDHLLMRWARTFKSIGWFRFKLEEESLEYLEKISPGFHPNLKTKLPKDK